MGGGTKLTRRRKTELREDKTFDFIKSRPSGEPIPLSDFQSVLGFNSYQTTHQFLKKLEVKGRLMIEAVAGTRTRCYTVIEQSNIITSKKTRWSASELEEMAKEYMWNNEDVSLKAFVSHLKFISGK